MQHSAIIRTFRKPAAVPSPVNLQAEPDRIALLTHDLRLFFLLTDNDADPAERLQNTRRLAATAGVKALHGQALTDRGFRSEEHTSELQSLMRISYAVFCLKKKNKKNKITS